MMKTGIFGGTFNPPHKGHTRLAEKAAEFLGLDRMLIIPSCIPPHKIPGKLAGGDDRMEMCRLAFEGDFYEISSMELDRGDKSYTVETLRELKKLYPDDEFYFIIGSDMLSTFNQWYCWEEILTLAHICAASREKSFVPDLSAYTQEQKERFVILDIEPFEVSSTQLRRIIAGEGETDLLDEKVRRYIEENDLYDDGLSEYRKILYPKLDGFRINHSECVSECAATLAERYGADVEIFVIKNLVDVKESVDAFASKIKNSQIIFVPGGFSGGDEPDGSGKFITAFFRNKAIKENVSDLLDVRKGLVGGICNGFQALIKLGLVPYGKITDEMSEDMPTLTFNTIARHQSMLVKTRIASNKSPWLMQTEVGDVYTVPISHGEGRFIIKPDLLEKLIANGQIATQYVDGSGKPTYDIKFNPNNSYYAIEGITSPDGRVFGKMGHSERTGNGLYKNVYGEYDIKMFDSAVKYFK